MLPLHTSLIILEDSRFNTFISRQRQQLFVSDFEVTDIVYSEM